MSTSTSRWLTWIPPTTSEIRETRLDVEPPKPSKHGCEGFEGSSADTFSIIEPTEPKATPHFERRDETECGLDRPLDKVDPLWGDPCPCGSRDWRMMSDAMLECIVCGKVVRSDYLATGGRP